MKKERMLSAAPIAVALAAVCALFIFRAAWGAPARAAETSGLPDLPFYQPITVEELREQISAQGQDVTVVRPDGSIRESGRIVTGDVIRIMDEYGDIVDQYTAVVMTGESSTAPGSLPDGASSSPPENPDSSRQDPVSSRPADSGVSSQPEEGIGVLKGDENGFYTFANPVTVEDLAAEIGTQPHGLWLRVTAPSGESRPSGAVCTGDRVETLDGDGVLKSLVTAVIPGDLKGDGAVTEEGLELLRDCLLNRDTLSGVESRAADMNRDGCVDTSDLLLMEKNKRTE